MKINQSPVPDGAEFCCTARYQCEHLLIPTSNSFKSDRCLMFGISVDRDGRQRPARIDSCLSRWKTTK